MSARKTPPRTCPICAQPATAGFRPFCSARCKDEDLRRWLVGAYRIPASPALGSEESAPAAEEDEE